MPNWCSSSYVIEGDKKEVKKLYGIMHGLEKRKTPAVKNGFGTAWLGCLVNALGADWNKVYCSIMDKLQQKTSEMRKNKGEKIHERL